MTHGYDSEAESCASLPRVGVAWQRGSSVNAGNRGLLHFGYLALHGCCAEYGCFAYACPSDSFRKGIVELSPDYPLCTLPYVFPSKIPKKRGGDSFPLETVILAEGILKDPLFAKTPSCTTRCCF